MTSKLHQAERSLALLQAGGVANRMMATADGSLMAMQQAGVGMLAPGVAVRAATKIVAASNASPAMLAQADYVCDNVADEVQINAALAALPAAGGTVLLSEGTFTLAAPVVFGAARRVLRGMGMGATTLAVVTAVGAPAIAVINTTIVQLSYDYDEIRDLTIDGNKTGNPTATSMTGLQAQVVAPLIERVRITNSAGLGLMTVGNVANGVIRDCLIDGSASHGALLRAAAGQPLVVSGCTAKGGGNYGFNCDGGPVVLSDCQALSNVSVGFVVSGTGPVSLSNCLSQSNSQYGIAVSGARAMLTNCRSIKNVSYGIYLNGSQIQLVGCVASGTTGAGLGFVADTGTVDALFSGCASADNESVGFHHSTTGRALYVGCRATDNTSYGFITYNGEAQIRDCFVSGGAHGVYITGGGSHAVDGCRIVNASGYGIYVNPNAGDVQITNNLISDVSTSGNNSYIHIYTEGDRAFIHGNMLRDPAAGNVPGYGIYQSAAADGTLIGHNDTFGLRGVYGQIGDGGSTNTRRTSRLALDYVDAADQAGAATAGTWVDACANQSFTVLSPTSLVQFVIRGSILVGVTTVGSGCQSRILLDSTVGYKIGGALNETGTYYSNVLSGGQVITLAGLAVGTHTVRVQVNSNYAATFYCRAGSIPTQEALAIQVTEFAR